MKLVLFFGLLFLLHNKAWSKAVEDDIDYDLQKDEYTDEYDEDSADINEDDDGEEPKFISKPQHFNVKPESDISLPCNISGNTASYTIMWKKNNDIIFQEKILFATFDPKKYVLSNTTLIIKNIDPEDAGDYKCIILGTIDNVILKHTVTVESSPKITALTSDKSTLEYKSGDKLELTCTATGNPEPKIVWSLHGKHVGMGNKIIIENIRHDNTGDFQCMADNGINPVDHKSISIKVMHKPIVTLGKLTTNINGDDYDIELRCTVRSNPSAIVIWKKDGEEIKLQSRRKNNVHILHLKKVNSTHFGKYSCRADNQVGVTEQHILITNAPSKALYKEGNDINGKDFNLKWEVESLYPITEYLLEYKKLSEKEWIQEKPEVTNSESGNLYYINYVLKNLENGKYEVRVKSKNQWGWSEDSEHTVLTAHNAHHGHKHNKNHPDNIPISTNEEDNNIALETRLEGSQTSSAVHLVPTTSIICLFVLMLLNRH